LLDAIRQVRRGEVSLHPTIARKVLRELSQPAAQQQAVDALTERELEVLKLIARGLIDNTTKRGTIVYCVTPQVLAAALMHNPLCVNSICSVYKQ
jgi:FixJ family two-component response regulator